MQYVITSFDYKKYPPRPLESLLINDNDKRFFIFYKPGTGLKIEKILANINEFRSLIINHETLLNDYKAHILAFNLNMIDNIYDLCIPHIDLHSSKALIDIMRVIIKKKIMGWHKLLAGASIIYNHFESVNISCGYRRMFVQYSLETLTGRSKTLNFNLQGTTSEYDIRPPNNRGYFIHFDWIGADLLMAAHMSGDIDMLNSFRNSDPYSYIVDKYGEQSYGRDKCKKDFLSAIYSLSFNEPIIAFFPTLRKWMIERHAKMMLDGCLDTILGRKFYLKGNNILSVFNAQFQGSVVHAMQAILIKLYGDYKDNLFAEVHDSIVMVCDEVDLKGIIADVANRMTNPLDGWCDNPPFMPVKVSVGRRWKKWVKYREWRQPLS